MAKKPNPLLKGIPSKPGAKASKKASPDASSRDGKKLIAGHFKPEVAKALKLLAVEDDTTVQALVGEALDLLFKKKNIKITVE